MAHKLLILLYLVNSVCTIENSGTFASLFLESWEWPGNEVYGIIIIVRYNTHIYIILREKPGWLNRYNPLLFQHLWHYLKYFSSLSHPPNAKSEKGSGLMHLILLSPVCANQFQVCSHMTCAITTQPANICFGEVDAWVDVKSTIITLWGKQECVAYEPTMRHHVVDIIIAFPGPICIWPDLFSLFALEGGWLTRLVSSFIYMQRFWILRSTISLLGEVSTQQGWSQCRIYHTSLAPKHCANWSKHLVITKGHKPICQGKHDKVTQAQTSMAFIVHIYHFFIVVYRKLCLISVPLAILPFFSTWQCPNNMGQWGECKEETESAPVKIEGAGQTCRTQDEDRFVDDTETAMVLFKCHSLCSTMLYQLATYHNYRTRACNVTTLHVKPNQRNITSLVVTIYVLVNNHIPRSGKNEGLA